MKASIQVVCQHVLAILVLTLLGLTVTSAPAPAQSAPSTCKPNAGATQDCVSELLTPYTFLNAACNTSPPYLSSEAESESLWNAEFLATYTSCPGSTFNRFGWIPSGAPMCVGGYCGPGYTIVSLACGGGPSIYPYLTGSGRETNNWLVYQVGGNQNPPSCQPIQSYYTGKVRRDRGPYCPRGYAWTGSYCYLNGVDPAKNLGPQCPKCGNPITPGTGNKFQKEVDYVGGGEYPLTFVRYYNSQQRIGDRDQGYFGFAEYFDRYGNEAFYALASKQGRVGYPYGAGQDRRDALRWTNLGLDSIGANWRHNYQRSIFYAESNANGAASATAFRHDGRVLAFIEHNGAFYAQADISDRLSGSPTTGWTYVSAETEETETYDGDGRLVSIRSRAGRTHTLQYDADGRLLSVTDGFGHTLTFAYSLPPGDSNGVQRITAMTDPAGNTYQYGYGANATLTSVTYPGGASRQYQYTGPTARALTGIVDENGAAFATFSYDAYGQATLSAHAGGAEQVSIAYTKTGDTQLGPATVTDSLGAVRTYQFTFKLGIPKVSSISQPAASGAGTVSSTYAYDANGSVSSTIDFNGRQTVYSYDLTRNLETSRTEANGTPKARTITTTWHPTFRLPAAITEPNRTTGYTYDTNGNALTRTVTDTSVAPNVLRTWTYTYTSVGQVLTEDGPRTDASDVTTYTYYNCTTGYQCGQIQTVTDANSRVTTFNTYNAHGQPLTITDPNGVVATLTYDNRQRLTSKTIGSETTTLEYWPTGLLKKVMLPDGSFTSYIYDNAHRLIEIDDGAGNRIVYTLDAMGNRTAENLYDPSSALSRTHTRVYNSLNKLLKEINAAGTPAVTTTFGYDDNGNQTAIDAPLTRHTGNSYDELNRLTQVLDPANGTTKFGYDANDNLTSVIDPRNLTTSYQYTGFGDVKQQVSPDNGTTTNTYDSGGNPKTSTDARSATATYSDDAMNRVTQVALGDQTITYGYDAGANGVGRLTSASDSAHSMSWAYDAQGRVTSKGQTVGAVTRTVGYGYTNGNLTTLTTPSGQAIGYSYSNGQIVGITVNGATLLSQVLYEPFGPTRGWMWGNGTLAVRDYDADWQTTTIDSAGLSTYAYFDDGSIHSRADDASMTVGVPNGTTNYTPAATSNRLASSTGVQARTYGYDAVGNTTSYTGLTFSYNNRGRMASTSGGSTSYAYNALGQRVKKSNASLTRLFVYDEASHLLGEYDGTGALIQETVWLGDIPVATIRPGTPAAVYYVHADHLNTPRRITRPSDNAVLWRWDSDPFGHAAANEDPDGNGQAFSFNLRFPGQYFDSETGLSQNYFRDYDSAIGRYVESDPIGLAAGVNTYGYVAANPLQRIDPAGEKARACCTPIAGGVLSPFDHCFIQVVNDDTNVSTTYALHRVSFGVGCKYKNDPFDIQALTNPATTCGPWKDDRCMSPNCVESAHSEYPSPSNYFYGGPNSNTYASQLAWRCGITLPPIANTWHAPGGRDAPSTPKPKAKCPLKR